MLITFHLSMNCSPFIRLAVWFVWTSENKSEQNMMQISRLSAVASQEEHQTPTTECLKTRYESDQLFTFCTIGHMRTSFLKNVRVKVSATKFYWFLWEKKDRTDFLLFCGTLKTQLFIILTWSSKCSNRFFITEAPEKTTEVRFSLEHIKQMNSSE